MKKLLLFLLLSVSAYAQQTPDAKKTLPPPESVTADPTSVYADGWSKAVHFTFTPDSSSCTSASMTDSCSPMEIMPGRWNSYSLIVIKSEHEGPCTVVFTCGGSEFTVTIQKEKH